MRAPRAPAADVAAPAQVPGDAQQAVVGRIVDGDTLEIAAVAAGPVLTSTGPVDVRLLEIDSPETKDPNRQAQCYGQVATAELTRLAPPGSTVWVQRDQELLDRYDRYLLYLWNAKGEFVNLSMVQSGHAAAVLYPPNDKHWATISSAESTARSASAAWAGAPARHSTAPHRKRTRRPCRTHRRHADTAARAETATRAEHITAAGRSVCARPRPGSDRHPPVQSGLPPQQLGPDTNCSDYPGPVIVAPGDPHRLDRDGDGIGCNGN